jgi:hypothetical protein
MKTTSLLVSLCGLALVSVACSGSDDGSPQFQDETPGKPAGSSGSSGVPDIGGGMPPKPGEFEACASQTVKGTSAPVHIVIALDISGSMCEQVEDPFAFRDCSDPGSKWQQTKMAFKSFFSDAKSADSYASIITWAGDSCNGYNTPRNPADVALPDTAGKLLGALSGVQPDGGTPTAAAIAGAVAYAKTLKASLTDNGQVVVALATDGEPTACGQMNGAKAAAAKSVIDKVPVYVIGVGSSVNNLDQIAMSAQTNGGKSILVQNDVATNLNKAMADIKGKSLGCGLQLPAATDGKPVDYGKVNLTFTNNNGATQTVPHSQGCTSPDGWTYTPSESAPTGIELCSAVCSSVKTNDKGSVGVVLGCATSSSPAK